MTKRTLPTIVVLCLLMAALGCKAYRTTKEVQKITVEDLASVEFQSDYEIVNNKDSTHALVFKEIKTRPNQIFATIQFFVYSYELGEKIHEGTLPQGKVKWINQYELLCESIPGRVGPKESGKKYIYNVQTQSTKPYNN